MSNLWLICYYTLGLGIIDRGTLKVLFMVCNPDLRHHEFVSMVTIDGRELSKIPVKFRSYEICLLAVKQNSGALCSVPNTILDCHLCVLAIKRNGMLISDIPNKFCTYELKLEAVKQNPSALRQLDLSLNVLSLDKQYALCLETARHSKYWLRLIPKKFHKNIQKELNI